VVAGVAALRRGQLPATPADAATDPT
jgi:hypothetical protein